MSTVDASAAVRPPTFWLRRGTLAVLLLGLLLRVLYVGMATVEFPIRGDVNQYVLYGWNLSHRATFSTALPDAADAHPDSYRAPGYPLLIAASMLATGGVELPLRDGPAGTRVLGYASDRWMRLVLAVQIVLGTLVVALTMAIARLWLANGWPLVAGAIVAVWPHLVSFTGVLLAETLFSFSLLLAVWCLCSAQRNGSPRSMALAGLVWGFAYLVNPVVALFPFLAAIPLWRTGQRRVAAVLLAAFVVLPAAWSARNALSADDAGAVHRVEENLVQGSWPQYHVAVNSRFENEISRHIVDAIDAETDQMKADPGGGLAAIGERLLSAPGFYLRWYALEKPYLLWDWRIRIGAGDIYFVDTRHSPFSVIPILRWLESACRAANPLLFALALAAILATLVAAIGWRASAAPSTLLILALLAVYLTAVHVALQAEPRYSVPYRPIEILLAVAALAQIGRYASRRRAAAVSARDSNA